MESRHIKARHEKRTKVVHKNVSQGYNVIKRSVNFLNKKDIKEKVNLIIKLASLLCWHFYKKNLNKEYTYHKKWNFK